MAFSARIASFSLSVRFNLNRRTSMTMLRPNTRSIDDGFGDQAIELGSAIIENMGLKLPRAYYHMLLPCPSWFDLSIQDILLIGLAISQDHTEAVDDFAATEELETSLFAHTVDSHIENEVLHGPSGDDMCCYNFTTLWPIGRQGDNIGPLQCQDARMLRELCVEADAHPDPAHLRLVDGKRQITMVQEAVNSEIRKVNLAVFPHKPLWTKESRHVVALIPMPFPADR